MRVLRFAFFCSAGAVVASLCAITLSARVERKSPWQPINASSHWLWGEQAGKRREPDIRHTAVGGTTNILAASFWGSLFGALISRHRRPTATEIIRDAGAMGAFAGLLDYGLVPKRLRPGWEHALSSRSVVISMATMALGLAAGGLAAIGLTRSAIGHRFADEVGPGKCSPQRRRNSSKSPPHLAIG